MLRLATLADVPPLIDMLIAFQAEAGCYDQIEPCRKSIQTSVEAMINGNLSAVAVYEMDGEIAGATSVVAYPSWFNMKQITGQEMFWYIKPEFRGRFGIALRMFKWLEAWAADKGLASLTVASTGTIKVEKLEKFYESNGYKRWDVLYTKGIESCQAQ